MNSIESNIINMDETRLVELTENEIRETNGGLFMLTMMLVGTVVNTSCALLYASWMVNGYIPYIDGGFFPPDGGGGEHRAWA
ncbi:hypothetical protein QUF70_08715 [Desulfobacterales bacterium HSG17]|nr:hypothetical protein [Desulfobacterales bacterium HSG17]